MLAWKFFPVLLNFFSHGLFFFNSSSPSRNMILEYEMYWKDEKVCVIIVVLCWFFFKSNCNKNLLYAFFKFQGERIQDVYKFQVMITTFEIILTDCMELKAIPWRCVIIDEAHRLKNRNCKLLEGLRMLNTVWIFKYYKIIEVNSLNTYYIYV